MGLIREGAMEEEIVKYLEKGYRIVCRGNDWAQLLRPKDFSPVWFLLLGILTAGFGAILYFANYMGNRDKAVYVGIGADGAVYSVEYES
jgi:hypothetical protein